jgi:2-polyprenyl-3-methyl-5-hydroxy-6-metoxy-1,4-benzoquinol methylase
MKHVTVNVFERFRIGAAKYGSYLETPERRLRLDLTLANLQEFLPWSPQPLHALDLGGGAGAIAVRQARRGLHVTLLDASLPMVDIAKTAVYTAQARS